MVWIATGLWLSVFLILISIFLFTISSFFGRKDGDRNHWPAFVGGCILSAVVILFTFLEHDAVVGSVIAEENLAAGKVYVVTYCSETKIEGRYLVVMEKRWLPNDKSRKPKPRVYLLSVKPPTSFYVNWIDDKIRYSDAAEVR